MKRIWTGVLTISMVFMLCACGQDTTKTADAWQEQYDLGVRYLSEGSYEEAIIAFSAAIEIDPKRAPAYVGRGNAYVLSGETEEHLVAAQSDYEMAIELDETYADAYLGLADVYIRRGEYDKALEVLRLGLEKTGNAQSLADKIAEITDGNIADSSGKTRKSSHYENGQLIQYWIYEYDEAGNNVRTINYNADDTLAGTEVSEYNALGQEIRMVYKREASQDSSVYTTVETYEYDSLGRKTRESRTNTDENGEITAGYTIISYDDENRTETQDDYEEGEFQQSFVIESDEKGVRQKGSSYRIDEGGQRYLDYYVEYIWNEDGTYGGYDLVQVAQHDE